ncbi:hypothetical protein E2C01_099897 [Portunus trituberculatus]|uniref:Uncharacterized protein n=1 Tax=Portunus trituberculatus TaxID=210409 RepID=A0A5B7K1J7_PORTR|nr:hypothetical protein [Portunus trituberculatus]
MSCASNIATTSGKWYPLGLGGIRVLDPDPPDPTRQEESDYQPLVLESTDDYLLAEAYPDESGTRIH